MRAAVAESYGPAEVVQVREIPKPVPGDGEILVRVYATTVSAGDVRLRAFWVPAVYWIPFRIEKGIFRPKDPVLGVEFDGIDGRGPRRESAQLGNLAVLGRPGELTKLAVVVVHSAQAGIDGVCPQRPLVVCVGEVG